MTAANLDALHRYLARKADSRGRVRLNLSELAGEIGTNQPQMSRWMGRLADAGIVRRLERGQRDGTWLVEPYEHAAHR